MFIVFVFTTRFDYLYKIIRDCVLVNLSAVDDCLELDRGGGGGGVRGLVDLLLEGSRGRGGGGRGVDAEDLDGEGADDVKVDESGAAVLGETNVEEEDGLEEPVEGDPVEDGVAPELNDGEGGVDNPVSEVLGVVLGALGLEGLEGVVAGDDEGGKVGKELANAANVDEDQKEVEKDNAKDTVGLGDAGLGLELLEGREAVKFLRLLVIAMMPANSIAKNRRKKAAHGRRSYLINLVDGSKDLVLDIGSKGHGGGLEKQSTLKCLKENKRDVRVPTVEGKGSRW